MKTYQTELLRTLVENYFNDFKGNNDAWYCECASVKLRQDSRFSRLKTSLKKAIIPKSYLERKIVKKYTQIFSPTYDFNFLYNSLERDEDRQFLLNVVAYKLLSSKRVKLADYKSHNELIQHAKKYVDFDDYISVNNNDSYRLYKTNFRPKKDYQLYTTPLGYVVNIHEHIYSIPGIVSVENGDYVIDCGGFSLDTAIMFAEMAGLNGKVFACEFVPDNLKICDANLALNPHLRDRITIIKKPLSDKSGEELVFCESASCTSLAPQLENAQSNRYISTTIDDFVAEHNVEKIDFIKMDIEGSELAALKGAEKTIKKYHPKLAISIYHKLEDLDTIPRLIKSFHDYKLYIGYTGCVDAEYVLFCKP